MVILPNGLGSPIARLDMSLSTGKTHMAACNSCCDVKRTLVSVFIFGTRKRERNIREKNLCLRSVLADLATIDRIESEVSGNAVGIDSASQSDLEDIGFTENGCSLVLLCYNLGSQLVAFSLLNQLM